MNAKGESILLRALAAVLLVGIAFNGVRLSVLVSDERELDALASGERAADARLADLLSMDAERLSDDQARRRDALEHGLIVENLLHGLQVTTATGATAPLGNGRPTGVAAPATRLRLALDPDSAIASLVTAVTISGRRAEFSRGVTELDVDVDADGRTVLRPSFSCGGGEVSHASLDLVLRRDDRPPQIAFTRDGADATPRDGDRLDVRPDEPLRIRVDDESRLAEVTWQVTRDGRALPRRTAALGSMQETRDFAVDYGGEILHETEIVLTVEAVDSAGNRATETVRVARWKRPPPEVTGVWIDDGPAEGECVTNAAEVVASIAVTDLDAGTTLEVVNGEARVVLEKSDRGRRSARVGLTGELTPLKFVAESDGWRTTIAEVVVRRDVTAPRIALLDAKGAPLVVDEIEVDEAASLEVWVSDDGGLARDGVRVDRKGRIGLSSPTVDATSYRRPVRIDESSTLTITAVDAAGNESERSLRFEVRPALPADDGNGPGIALRAGGTALSPESDAVFVGSPPVLELEVTDAAGVADVEVEGGETGHGPEGLPTVTAAGPVTVTATDVHGRKTTRRFPITLVRETPRVTRLDDVRTPGGEAILQLTHAPRTFRFVSPDRPPEGLVSARLERPGGEPTLTLETGAGGGTFPADPALGEGTWVLVLSLAAFDGVHDVDRVTFAVTKPAGPALTVTMAGKIVPDGSPMRVAALDELLVTAPAGAEVQAVLDGVALKLTRDDGGWRPQNPPRSTGGGTLVVRGTSADAATTELRFGVRAVPYRMTAELAHRLAEAESRLDAGDVDDAATIVAEVESAVVEALAARLDRRRGVELAKLADVRHRVDTARSAADAEGNGVGSRDSAVDVTDLARTITNERDGAPLVLVNAGTPPFYLYETEVTLEMFRRFLDATLPDSEFWEARGLSGRTLGVFKEKMRSLFVKSDDRKTFPARNMRGEWAEAYAAWAAGGLARGRTLRLPTVEEWMRAASGGNETAYPTTGAFADGSDVGQHQNRAGANWFTRKPKPVGWYDPGAFGLHDMAGNVVELCRGHEDDDAYHLVGGSYLCRQKKDLALSAVRPYVGSKTEPRTIGFRLLLEIR